MNTQRTDQKRTVRWLSTVLLFGAILTLIIPAGAWAAGTSAGTPISNQATINYQVNGAAQDQIDSEDVNTGGATVFMVDNRVDLTMTSPVAATATPSSTTTAALFTIQNDGNANQGYRIDIQDPGSNAFDMTTVDIYLDDGTTAGTFDGSNSLYYQFTPGSSGSFMLANQRAGNVSEDGTLNFWVVATVPASAADTQQAAYHLVATTLNANSDDETTEDAGAWQAMGTPQVVFGDGTGVAGVDIDGDGKFSTTITYTVATATLTATKDSAVISDPFSSSNPKAIPGAVIQYTITIANSGSEDAGNIVVSDAIPANTWFHAATAVTGGTASFSNDDGATYGYTPSADANGADENVDALQVAVGTIAADDSATVTFSVIIQ